MGEPRPVGETLARLPSGRRPERSPLEGRTVRLELTDDRLEGHSQLNKDHLLPILCDVLGVEAHAHHEVVGIDKGAIKNQIKALKAERDAAVAAHDKARTKKARREIHHLKRKLHQFTV